MPPGVTVTDGWSLAGLLLILAAGVITARLTGKTAASTPPAPPSTTHVPTPDGQGIYVDLRGVPSNLATALVMMSRTVAQLQEQVAELMDERDRARDDRADVARALRDTIDWIRSITPHLPPGLVAPPALSDRVQHLIRKV